MRMAFNILIFIKPRVLNFAVVTLPEERYFLGTSRGKAISSYSVTPQYITTRVLTRRCDVIIIRSNSWLLMYARKKKRLYLRRTSFLLTRGKRAPTRVSPVTILYTLLGYHKAERTLKEQNTIPSCWLHFYPNSSEMLVFGKNFIDKTKQNKTLGKIFVEERNKRQ